MNYKTIRAAGIEELRKRGVDIDLGAKLPEVCAAIQKLTGKTKGWRGSDGNYVRAWLESSKQAELARVATPPQTFERGEYHPKRHPRQAEIDAQLRQVSMGWDGNGAPWRQSY